MAVLVLGSNRAIQIRSRQMKKMGEENLKAEYEDEKNIKEMVAHMVTFWDPNLLFSKWHNGNRKPVLFMFSI